MENKELIELLYLVMVLVVVLCALFVGHEVGYRQGYTYVLEFKENYEARYCTCSDQLKLFNFTRLTGES